MSENRKICFKNRIIFPNHIAHEDEIAELVLIAFCLLPVDVIDISSHSNAINIVQSSIKKAKSLHESHFNENLDAPEMQLSIYCSDFHTNPTIFEDFVSRDINLFELHIDKADDELALNAFTAMINQQAIKNFYTINLNRKFHSNSQLKILISKLQELVPKDSLNICINGNEDNFDSNSKDYFNSVQALATCDIIIQDLKIRERKKFKNLKIHLTDEVNYKTAAMVKLCQLDIDSLSFGSHSSSSFFDGIFKEISNTDLKQYAYYPDFSHLIKMCVKNFMDYNFNFYK